MVARRDSNDDSNLVAAFPTSSTNLLARFTADLGKIKRKLHDRDAPLGIRVAGLIANETSNPTDEPYPRRLRHRRCILSGRSFARMCFRESLQLCSDLLLLES